MGNAEAMTARGETSGDPSKVPGGACFIAFAKFSELVA
jgi:hypothetical protein